MPRRSRVEDDVVELGSCGSIAQDLRELVKCCNLRGARAGELLLHAPDGSLGQDAPIRSHHPLAVGVGGGRGVDVHGEQVGHGGDWCGRHPQLSLKDLAQVRGRVGAHQEHPLASIGKADGGGACDRGLADAALAREEEVSS